MFHGFDSDIPSSVAKRTHPRQQTCITRKGPSQRGARGGRAFTDEYAPEHQIVHLELPTIHEPMVIALERLIVLCISKSCLPSSLIDEVDIITPELVLRGFVVCLDTEGDHGGLRGIIASAPYTKKKDVSPVA
jgi:hypothetical protein